MVEKHPSHCGHFDACASGTKNSKNVTVCKAWLMVASICLLCMQRHQAGAILATASQLELGKLQCHWYLHQSISCLVFLLFSSAVVPDIVYARILWCSRDWSHCDDKCNFKFLVQNNGDVFAKLLDAINCNCH